jgi:hypothetical protein
MAERSVSCALDSVNSNRVRLGRHRKRNHTQFLEHGEFSEAQRTASQPSLHAIDKVTPRRNMRVTSGPFIV